MKKKGLFIFVLILFLLTAAGAGIGYYESTKKPQEIIDNGEKITYIYYLDDTVVDINTLTGKLEEPTIEDQIEDDTQVQEETVESTEQNTLETEEPKVEEKKILAVFNNYSCTNGVTGTWDNENWVFVPNEEKIATCNIYFNKAAYDVTLTVTGGEVAAEQGAVAEGSTIVSILRDQNATITINPYEGYEFNSEALTCSNSKEATWNPNDNTLLINNITEDVTCKVGFKLKSLTFEVKVENGKADKDTQTIDFGSVASAIITPNDGFEMTNEVSCTNNVKATVSGNKVAVDKLIDSTVCTVKIDKVKLKEFELFIDNSAASNIEFKKGSAGGTTVTQDETYTFEIKAKDGYAIDKVTCDDSPIQGSPNSDGSISYTTPKVNAKMECKITEKATE